MFTETPHDFVDVPHGRLAHWKFGRGPDIVAIHGWPLHAATFRRVIPQLAAEFTVHLFDLPGVGRTRWSGPIGFDANAEAIREAASAVGLARYGLVAHDSGGVVARVVAADNPKVWGLVLTGTEIPGHHGNLLRLYLLAARVPGMGLALAAALQIPVLRRSPLALGACFTDPSYADGEFTKLFIEPLKVPDVRSGQLAVLRTFRFEYLDSLVAVHARIAAPTLCIWGGRDPFFPIAKARAMLPQFAGGATLEEIPGAKLFLHEDHADAFAKHCRRFLTSVA